MYIRVGLLNLIYYVVIMYTNIFTCMYIVVDSTIYDLVINWSFILLYYQHTHIHTYIHTHTYHTLPTHTKCVVKKIVQHNYVFISYNTHAIHTIHTCAIHTTHHCLTPLHLPQDTGLSHCMIVQQDCWVASSSQNYSFHLASTSVIRERTNVRYLIIITVFFYSSHSIILFS